MNIDLINKVSSLIEKLPNNVRGNNSISSEHILNSESEYQLKLPNYYKWFIQNYEYIYLWGEPTKTILPKDFQNDSDEDIFGYYQICLDNDEYRNRLVFLSAEDLEEYYFLINEDNSVSEEVYFSDLKIGISNELHSDNFLEFLIKELPKNYRELR